MTAPREPTKEMLAQGRVNFFGNRYEDNRLMHETSLRSLWRAMYDAAPHAAPPEPAPDALRQKIMEAMFPCAQYASRWYEWPGTYSFADAALSVVRPIIEQQARDLDVQRRAKEAAISLWETAAADAERAESARATLADKLRAAEADALAAGELLHLAPGLPLEIAERDELVRWTDAIIGLLILFNKEMVDAESTIAARAKAAR